MYGIDIEYILMGLGGSILVLLLLIIILFGKLSKLNKKYNAFMKGENGGSLEDQIKANYDTMKKINLKQQEQELALLELSDQMDTGMSKMKLVRYNAFRDTGGQLSFALTVLNDNRDGYILNCMHNNSGSYIYAKEIKHGKCEFELSQEEEESLQGAINS